ncbi:MAG: CHC2 zinc finger domain-containing protein [Chloroflexota bacterium]
MNNTPKKTLLQAALWWLKRGCMILPVQPNSKKVVPGFGFYRDRIRTPERVYQWFGERSLANLAVCATQTTLILDFDDADLYAYWANKFPKESKTYTERTPRGGYHVFAYAWREELKGVTLVKGVELKHVVLVYPSVVNNIAYLRGEGDLLNVDAQIILSPLSQSRIIKPAPRVNTQGGGKLQKIKSVFLCLDLIQSANPNVKIYGSTNRFVSVPCPFHDDKEPSFWIDTIRNLWGCHACGIRGDVINLYARLKGITNDQAIREMGEGL